MDSSNTGIPSIEQIRSAVEIYAGRAYPQGAPEAVTEKFMPQAHQRPEEWLMGEQTERTPDTDELPEVRAFALRIGNEVYPHMKLRIARPPKDACFLFTVDAHDACLRVPPESPEYQALEELKAHNAEIARLVLEDWDAAGLPTERAYLREKIKRMGKPGGPAPQ